MTLPRPIQILLALIGAGMGLTALAGMVMTFVQKPPAFFFFGFELVVLVASVFVVLLGIGRIKEGPAITLLCAAGAIGAGTYLGYKASFQNVAGYDLKYLTAARLLVAALLVFAAAMDVVLRDVRNTLPRLVKGVLFLIPLGAIGFMVWRGFIPQAIASLSNSSPGLALGAWLLVLLICGILVCAAAHYFIRAFQIGVEAWDRRYRVSPVDPPPAAATPIPPAAPAR